MGELCPLQTARKGREGPPGMGIGIPPMRTISQPWAVDDSDSPPLPPLRALQNPEQAA